MNICEAQERLLYWLKDSACDFGFKDRYISTVPLWFYALFNLLILLCLLIFHFVKYRSSTILLLARGAIAYFFRCTLFNTSLTGYVGYITGGPSLNAILGIVTTVISVCTMLNELNEQPSLFELQISLQVYELSILSVYGLILLCFHRIIMANGTMMDDTDQKQVIILMLYGTFCLSVLMFIKILLEKLMWVRGSFYSRNGALWLVSFTAIYAFKPGLVVVLYFMWKLLLLVAMDLYLTKKEHIQVLLTTNQAGIPLRLFNMDFPAPAQRLIVNSVLVDLAKIMKEGKNKEQTAEIAQQYSLWTDSIGLLSDTNRRNLAHSLAHFPSKPFFLSLFNSKRSLREWSKLKLYLEKMVKESSANLLLRDKLANMSDFVELAENKTQFLWVSGKGKCGFVRLPRGVHLLIVYYF
jgi:hypothetical protein